MWLIVHSVVLTALSAALIFGADNIGRMVAGALVAEACVAFFMLFVEGGAPSIRVANAVTGFRLAVGVLALATVAVGVDPWCGAALIVFLALVAGEASDFVDGYIARLSGPTAFGARLDLETDAFFMLTLTVIAVVSYGLPRWVVVAGLLRYVVAVPFFLIPEPRFPQAFSSFAKNVTTTAAIALLIAVSPVLTPEWLRRVGSALGVVILTISFGWEAVIRATEYRRNGRALVLSGGRMFGLARSFIVHYGIPLRLIRMKRFYGKFVKSGDLVMDIGAHLGNRVRAMRSLGARVIAVEPQGPCVELLNRLYGQDPDVVVEAVACGAQSGEAMLHFDPARPTLATLSDEWMRDIDRNYRQLGIKWDQSESIKVRTLDDLIQEYGVPTFIKIDAEGYESEALIGLRHRIRVISFEILPASADSALLSLDEIERIGSYMFNYSMVETMRFESSSLLTSDNLRAVIRSMPPTGPSGDVYAFLQKPDE